jgi:hypothetical protein
MALHFIKPSRNFISFPLAPTLELGPLWSIGLISQSLDYLQTVEFLGQVISSSQGLYLYTGQHKLRKTHTHTHTSNIYALSGIRTHDPGFRANKDSTWRSATVKGKKLHCIFIKIFLLHSRNLLSAKYYDIELYNGRAIAQAVSR